MIDNARHQYRINCFLGKNSSSALNLGKIIKPENEEECQFVYYPLKISFMYPCKSRSVKKKKEKQCLPKRLRSRNRSTVLT